MGDATRQRANERKAAQRKAGEAHLKHSGTSLKRAFKVLEQAQLERFSIHAADAIVRIVQACDAVEISVMPKVFDKLKQIDRG